MEAHNGNPRKARELFQQGADKCEPHAPLFNAWAHFEARPFSARRPYELLWMHWPQGTDDEWGVDERPGR